MPGRCSIFAAGWFHWLACQRCNLGVVQTGWPDHLRGLTSSIRPINARRELHEHHRFKIARKHVGMDHAKGIVRKLLQWHLPVGYLNRPLFGALYQLHVALRAAAGWSIRFLWYEPLFRSQCRTIGERFWMEQLPYMTGRGEIVIGNDVRFSGKPSFAFSSRYSPRPKLSIGHGSFSGAQLR